MPGPLEDSLSRFTPSSGGLDRDGLLFAAGRASARPGRRWPTVAALLALSQALTLALLVAGTPPRPQPTAPPEPSAPSESIAPVPPTPGPWRSTLDELPAPEPASSDLMPDEPPLHVSSTWNELLTP